MNSTDRAELDECRQTMLKMFLDVATPILDSKETKIFLKANDRHQEILAEDTE